MNTQTYRVIFNKSRGCLMAVAESARSSGGGGCSGARRRKHTTQHQTLDQEAERTRIQAGSQAVVLGQNVGSLGAQVQGKTLTQIEGADKTLLYDVQEVHQYSTNSQTSKDFLGITYSNRSSQDNSLQSNALNRPGFRGGQLV